MGPVVFFDWIFKSLRQGDIFPLNEALKKGGFFCPKIEVNNFIQRTL